MLTNLAPGTLWLTVFLLFPLAVMLLYSFGQVRGYGEFFIGPKDLGFQQYHRFFIPDETSVLGATWITVAWLIDAVVPGSLHLVSTQPTPYVQLLFKSIGFGVQATVLCFVVGYPIAYYLGRLAPARFQELLLVLIIVPWWASFLARVYSIQIILAKNGLLSRLLGALPFVPDGVTLMHSKTAVLFGLVYVWVPLMILPAYASIEQLDGTLQEAAMDLGANRIDAFLRITFPLSMPGVVAGSSLIFIITTGSYVIPEILGGPNSKMVGNLIANTFGPAGNWPFGAASSFVFIIVVLSITLVYYRVMSEVGQ